MFAWPTAEFAMVGAEAAVRILYRKQIAEAADPEKTIQEKISEYHDDIVSPYYSASKQYVDAVIDPAETRKWFVQALRLFKNKKAAEQVWKKHGNIPL